MIKRGLVVLVMAVMLQSVSAAAAQAVGVIKARNNNNWGPARIKVDVNEKVVWKNPTSVEHIVKATTGGWHKNSRIGPGERTTHKFGMAGTYGYKCTLHSGMRGKVIVV